VSQKVPTKSAQIAVRFARGIPQKLTRIAAIRGQLRTEWVRTTVLERVNEVLNYGTQAVFPLPLASLPNMLGEGILVRFRPADLKNIERVAREEGLLTSTYIRAVCMKALHEEHKGRLAG
jgi:hypothetical protein